MMGGHRAGDVASRQVVGGLGNRLGKQNWPDSEKAAPMADPKIRQKSVSIYEKGIEDEALNGMGTTTTSVSTLLRINLTL